MRPDSTRLDSTPPAPPQGQKKEARYPKTTITHKCTRDTRTCIHAPPPRQANRAEPKPAPSNVAMNPTLPPPHQKRASYITNLRRVQKYRNPDAKGVPLNRSNSQLTYLQKRKSMPRWWSFYSAGVRQPQASALQRQPALLRVLPLSLLVVPICEKEFQRRCNGQSALLNQHYRGTTAVRASGSPVRPKPEPHRHGIPAPTHPSPTISPTEPTKMGITDRTKKTNKPNKQPQSANIDRTVQPDTFIIDPPAKGTPARFFF